MPSWVAGAQFAAVRAILSLCLSGLLLAQPAAAQMQFITVPAADGQVVIPPRSQPRMVAQPSWPAAPRVQRPVPAQAPLVIPAADATPLAGPALAVLLPLAAAALLGVGVPGSSGGGSGPARTTR